MKLRKYQVSKTHDSYSERSVWHKNHIIMRTSRKRPKPFWKLEEQGGPPIYTLSPREARTVLSDAQAGSIIKPPADIEDRTIPVGPSGQIPIQIVRPQGSRETLPVVMYFHGGGWVLGGFDTHERLERELTNKVNAAIVFVNYTPSPEAKYPVPIEEA